MYSGTAAQVLSALEPFGLKETGKGQYRANSPLRPGSNSHAFSLTLHDDEHGTFFDHVTGEKGSLYYLALRLGIETTPPPQPNSKRRYASLDDYATAHGITAESLRAAGWYQTIHKNRPALAFPTAGGTRWRFLDGQKPHYLNEPGYKACWYGLTPALAKRLADAGELVICNGEISTIVATHYGLSATCVTGGERAIPPTLTEELKTFLGGTQADYIPPIVVALDCDDTGRRAARLITQQLREAGFIARAVDLQLGEHGDLADFCMLHGTGTARALSQLPAISLDEAPVSPPERSWYIIPAADLARLPPIEWIIPGELPDRAITVLFGPSGAGKSFLALDYALRIAQTEPVLYMAGEGEYGYRQRIAAWCTHHHKTEGKLFMCIGAVQLLENGDLQAFLDANQRIRPRVVIIDTMARSMVGNDENSTRDMGLFIRACEDIKRTLDCAVLVIHHTNKGGVYERGNSALRGASDAMIKVTAEDDLICIESAKTKDATPFPTRYMQLVTVSLTLNGQPIESAVLVDADHVVHSPTDRLTTNQHKVLTTLEMEVFTNGARRDEILEHTGIAHSSLYRVLSRLLSAQLISQADKGAPYLITDAGRQALHAPRSAQA